MEHQWRVFPEGGLQGTTPSFLFQQLLMMMMIIQGEGTCCYCQIAKDGSMNHAIKWLYMSCLRMKNPKNKFICFMQLPSFKYIMGNIKVYKVMSIQLASLYILCITVCIMPLKDLHFYAFLITVQQEFIARRNICESCDFALRRNICYF